MRGRDLSTQAKVGAGHRFYSLSMHGATLMDC